ncbi:hypothetical protein LTR49_028067 [Elasticomyces elasticus]|nr:hypothetical protein LTR49_028067 [Elasticomyces elasticus]
MAANEASVREEKGASFPKYLRPYKYDELFLVAESSADDTVRLTQYGDGDGKMWHRSSAFAPSVGKAKLGASALIVGTGGRPSAVS